MKNPEKSQSASFGHSPEQIRVARMNLERSIRALRLRGEKGLQEEINRIYPQASSPDPTVIEGDLLRMRIGGPMPRTAPDSEATKQNDNAAPAEVPTPMTDEEIDEACSNLERCLEALDQEGEVGLQTELERIHPEPMKVIKMPDGTEMESGIPPDLPPGALPIHVFRRRKKS